MVCPALATQQQRAKESAGYIFHILKGLSDSLLEYFEDSSSIPEPIWSQILPAESIIDSIVEGDDDSPEAPWGYCNICELPNIGPGECGNCD